MRLRAYRDALPGRRSALQATCLATRSSSSLPVRTSASSDVAQAAYVRGAWLSTGDRVMISRDTPGSPWQACPCCPSWQHAWWVACMHSRTPSLSTAHAGRLFCSWEEHHCHHANMRPPKARSKCTTATTSACTPPCNGGWQPGWLDIQTDVIHKGRVALSLVPCDTLDETH